MKPGAPKDGAEGIRETPDDSSSECMVKSIPLEKRFI